MKDPKMSIDQAYKELQKLVKEFENDEIDLEKSIPRFKEGLELAAFLKEKLKSMKVEIEEVKGKFADEK
jgi:exodeoxyribonuclease VII small subunit